MAIVSAYQINQGNLQSGFYQVYDSYEDNVLGLGGGYFSVIHNNNNEEMGSGYVSQFIFPYCCGPTFYENYTGNIIYRYKVGSNWSNNKILDKECYDYIKIKDRAGVGQGSGAIIFIDEGNTQHILNVLNDNLVYMGSTVITTSNLKAILKNSNMSHINLKDDGTSGNSGIKFINLNNQENNLKVNNNNLVYNNNVILNQNNAVSLIPKASASTFGLAKIGYDETTETLIIKTE